MLTVHSLWDIQPDFCRCYCYFLCFHGKLQRFRRQFEGKTNKRYQSKHLSETNLQEERRKLCKNSVWSLTGPSWRGLLFPGSLNWIFAVSILHWLLSPFCCGSQLEGCTSYWASKRWVEGYQTRSLHLPYGEGITAGNQPELGSTSAWSLTPLCYLQQLCSFTVPLLSEVIKK